MFKYYCEKSTLKFYFQRW